MSEEQQDLRRALKRTAVALKQGGVSFALGGGYAVWALGGPEPEHDVDFVVAEDEVQRAEQVLTEAGLRIEHPPEDWLFKVYDGPAMTDLIFRVNDCPVGGSLLERAQEVEVCSIAMPVLSATDLVITKMLALSEHDGDVGKVLPSARALREQVDWDAVREAAQGKPFAKALLFLLVELHVAPAAAQR
jgi:predicted nucleotidyltransferase